MSLPYRHPSRPVNSSRTTVPLFVAAAGLWVGSMLMLFQR